MVYNIFTFIFLFPLFTFFLFSFVLNLLYFVFGSSSLFLLFNSHESISLYITGKTEIVERVNRARDEMEATTFILEYRGPEFCFFAGCV